ncbi:MAG TPA: hypothetical protein VIL46_07155 [Gemmataceae bacterium]
MRRTASILAVLALPLLLAAEPAASRYFAIEVIDADTGRGVPLVELRTTNEVRYYTDSHGLVAFDEPGLMGKEVFFHVHSHGYEYPKDGFGFRGARLKPVPGGSATLKVKRVNIAERLYRVTGVGIYRDSVLLGRDVPIKEPVINGLVAGQDSVLGVPYRGKIFWVWGDTSQPAYPLGNFGASGATSELPGKGGLDPAVGVDLKYFVDEKGFSRAMVPASAVPGPGPKWLGGLTTLTDPQGRERLVSGFARVKSLGEVLEIGLVVFNDETGAFDRLAHFDLDAPLHLDGHPFRVASGGDEYLYCGPGIPCAVRVRADWEDVQDPARYEGFTCLAPGARYAKGDTKLERTSDGKLVYGWKRDTPPLSFAQQEELVRAGLLKPGEGWLQLRDVETGKPVRPQGGSVRWNPYRGRWVMVFNEQGGTSLLGEVWFAEADTPVGPWAYARKIVTHDRYSFYNPVHHPFFDQDGGRVIYFEGTYSELFSGAPVKTPRYDYNQIMYRLDLSDPRLSLPVPVYRLRGGDGYLLREQVAGRKAWDRAEEIAFFALPPGSKREGAVPVFASGEGRKGEKPLFCVLPAERDAPEGTLLLYATRADDGGVRYTARKPGEQPEGAGEPVGRVWENPYALLLLDRGAEPR